MNDDVLYEDLKTAMRKTLAIRTELESELNRCEFQYNYYGETEITYIKFSTCLNSKKVSDKYTFDKYIEYLEERIYYLNKMFDKINEVYQKGKDNFDPLALDINILRAIDYAISEDE